MHTAVNAKPTTIQQRSAEATRVLREVLGLEDLKLLAAALAEVAADEAAHNHQFAQRIRETYHQIEEMKRPTPKPVRRNEPLAKLVPIVPPGEIRIDPHAPLDPYILIRLYGGHQLRAALDGYTLASLKEASATTQERNPGTKPTNKGRKDAIIDYIVEHVAGPGF